jgi:hypothetical protein
MHKKIIADQYYPSAGLKSGKEGVIEKPVINRKFR